VLRYRPRQIVPVPPAGRVALLSKVAPPVESPLEIELAAMQAVAVALQPLEPETRRQVLEWVTKRFG
jgi:hypothetical protein